MAKENLMGIPVVIIPNHAPLPISSILIDKLDTYRRRYK
jgi:hypothetical protein